MRQLNERRLLKINKKQEERLKELREQREVENVKTQPRNEPVHKSWFEKDDAIFVCLDGVSFSGFYKHENPSKNKWDTPTYTVSTPHGELVVERHTIKYRSVKDYSNVVVPEQLTKLSTHNLLKLLQATRHRSYHYQYDWAGDYISDRFTEDQIKAVLATREHIPSKREAKIANKYKSV